MKKLLPIIGLCVLSACSNDKKQDQEGPNILENISFTTDTLEVAVGEEVINSSAYYGFDLSEDGKTAFFFNNRDLQIHEIDLEEMSLVKRHPFDRDGPNRAPSFVNYFQYLPNQEFLLASFNGAGVYTLEGELIQKLEINSDMISGFENENLLLTNNLHLSRNKSKALSLPRTFEGSILGLGIIDLKSMNAKSLDLPAMKITENYRVTFSEGGGSTSYGDFEQISKINSKFFIHSGATSDVYVYDADIDSLQLKSFPHQLVAKTKTGDFQTTVDSRERMLDINKEMSNQIDFGPFLWDHSNQQYFRFASKILAFDEEGASSKSDFYLFVYDEDLNLLAEGKVKDFRSLHKISFFKDGKLYCYSSVNENPGFIVYKFDF